MVMLGTRHGLAGRFSRLEDTWAGTDQVLDCAGQVSVLAQQLVHRYRGQAHQDLDLLAGGDDTRCSSQS
jgi:hypothetical protein